MREAQRCFLAEVDRDVLSATTRVRTRYGYPAVNSLMGRTCEKNGSEPIYSIYSALS